MSDHTPIQFADSTVNLMMGCNVPCELRPTPDHARESAHRFFQSEFPQAPAARIDAVLDDVVSDHNASEIYQLRVHIVRKMCAALSGRSMDDDDLTAMASRLKHSFDEIYVCFAHELHLMRGIDITKPDKRPHPGHAPQFEQVTLFPGRVAKAASLSDLFGKVRRDKPWLDYLPRSIFISDMGDALSEAVEFDYLKTEIIDEVGTEHGLRHLWQWITKNPKRMAEFGKWLEDQGVAWPGNLVPVNTVTSRKTVVRITQLMSVPSRFKGVIAEPLWEQVTLPLENVDWCIVGGQSGHRPKPFDLAWIQSLQSQCEGAGTSLFVKQLGSNPIWNGTPLKLTHDHGGDWSEWPDEFRIREMPAAFRALRLQQMTS
jgi:protein gp37